MRRGRNGVRREMAKRGGKTCEKHDAARDEKRGRV